MACISSIVSRIISFDTRMGIDNKDNTFCTSMIMNINGNLEFASRYYHILELMFP